MDASRASERPASDLDPSVSEDPSIDLREPARSRWDDIAVPTGWEPIAAIAREVADNLDPLVDRITDSVVNEIPAYRSGGIPTADLRASVRRNLMAVLVGLAEHRPPRADEVHVRRQLGARRALQGLPVDALIQAYLIGYRELWLALVAAVPGHGPQAATLLLTAATLVWRWVHEVTNELAAAHAATSRSVEARAVGARQRFVELLAAGDVDGLETHQLAGSLAFVPEAPFRVVVVRGVADDLLVLDLQRDVDGLPGRQAVAARGPLVIVVSQGVGPTKVAERCRAAFPAAAIGVGAERSGLRGARASLHDAEHVTTITTDGATGWFDELWLWATLADQRERLRPVLAAGADVAAEHPHLADAVEAFADAGFSVSEAARRLGLHPNTVTYRLERWQVLTGWDPRSYAGLTRSIAALRLPTDR